MLIDREKPANLPVASLPINHGTLRESLFAHAGANIYIYLYTQVQTRCTKKVFETHIFRMDLLDNKIIC